MSEKPPKSKGSADEPPRPYRRPRLLPYDAPRLQVYGRVQDLTRQLQFAGPSDSGNNNMAMFFPS